jgi:hypothetical protein
MVGEQVLMSSEQFLWKQLKKLRNIQIMFDRCFSKLWEIKKQVELTQNISSRQSSDDPAIRIE